MQQESEYSNLPEATAHFYNTINEQGAELAASIEKAKTQEDLILGIYKRAEYDLTASDVWRWMKMYNTAVLLTSVRRAISDLCTQGRMVKTERMRAGLYGKNEHLYTLVK